MFVRRIDGPFPLFLSGCLLGVCITVCVFHLRGPVSQKLLARRAANNVAVKALVSIRSNDTSIGVATAPVTLIEYSDFQCPYCAMFRKETFPEIKAKYIDSGKLRFIPRHLPLPSHAQAMPAARVVACAAEQGSYWQLSEVMFSRASCLACNGAAELARSVPLDRRRFEECVSSNRLQPQIDEDIASAKQLNFNGTPSFVLGRTTSRGVEGVAISGALPFQEFQAKIEEMIGKSGKAGDATEAL